MRHLLVLPGNIVKNKVWGELMLATYASSFDSSFMLEYEHWTQGTGTIDFVIEETKIRQHIAGLPPDTAVILFAKSAGSLLSFLAIHHGAIIPAQVVFFGIPFDLAAQDLFKNDWSVVDDFTIPAVAFHNVDDPVTSYEFTKSTLATHAPHVQLVATHETDHWYGDVDTYLPFIQTKQLN